MTHYPARLTRIFWLALAIAPVTIAPAMAQDRGNAAQTQRAPSNIPYLSSTGETVPNVGASQSDGVTDLDRRIEDRDDRIMNSICKNC